MTNILLTGGAGYIGSHITHDLIDQGFNVTVLDNLVSGNNRLIPKKAKFIKTDIGNLNFINKIFQRPEKLNFRWRIINPALVLVLVSCLTLKYTNSDASFFASTYMKQLVWLSLGLIVFMVVQWFRVHFLHEYAYHFYVLLLLMIFLTYFMPAIGGSQRWILLGPLSIQPSEIGKLLLVFLGRCNLYVPWANK